MTTSPVRVILADDHTLVRGGIRRILEGEARHRRWWARPPTATRPSRSSRRTDADVLVLDLNMPGRDGIEVLRGVEGSSSRPEGDRADDARGARVRGARGAGAAPTPTC